MPPPHPDHPDDPLSHRRRRWMRKLVVGALIGGTALFGGATAAQAYDDGGYSSASSDAGYDSGGGYDSGYSDVGGYDSGYSDVGTYDAGYPDTTTYGSGSPSYDAYADSVDTSAYDTGVDDTAAADPVDTTSYGTTTTSVDEVTSEWGGEDGAATGDTVAGTPTDHVDPTDGLTDDAAGTYTTTHQVGTETETVAPATVDGWASDPEAANSTTTTFEGTETVQETGIPSVGTDGAVAGSLEESIDHLTVSETTTTVAPVDGEGWTTTQVDRTEYGPGLGVDLDPTDGTLSGSATYQGEASSSYEAGEDLGSWSIGTGYDLTAGADATAEVTLDTDSVGVDLGLEGTASAAGHVGLTVGEDTFAETELTGTATVEGEVQVGVEADLGLTEGSADVGLFGGLSGTLEGEAEVAGITGTVGVTGTVGAGVGAGFDYSAEDGVFSVSGHVHGAAVLGGGISGGITVDTGELAESATRAADAIGTAVSDGWNTASQAVSDGWDATTQAVSDGWSSFTSGVSGFFGGRD